MAHSDEEHLQAAWGKSLKARREAMGLSQHQLAQVTGMRDTTIWRIEKGQRFPSERAKRLLAGALRVSIGELFPYSPTPPPVPEQVGGEAA